MTSKTDMGIVAAAGTAPMWAVPLGEVNEMLTTVSLVLAIVLALGRVVIWLRDRNKKK
jgi:hypothetical protein